MKRFIIIAAAMALMAGQQATAQKVVPIKYGNMDHWVTRVIKESGIIGGQTKHVYEIGPTQTINGAKAYTNLGGSPWGSSNVYAKVMGVVKTSNAVFPDTHGGCGYHQHGCAGQRIHLPRTDDGATVEH